MLIQETWGTPNKFVFCILPHRNMHVHCTRHTCYWNLWKHDDLSSGKGETFRDMQSSWWQVRSSFPLVVQQQFSQPPKTDRLELFSFCCNDKISHERETLSFKQLQLKSINTLCYHPKVDNFTVFPFLSEWHNIPLKKKKRLTGCQYDANCTLQYFQVYIVWSISACSLITYLPAMHWKFLTVKCDTDFSGPQHSFYSQTSLS